MNSVKKLEQLTKIKLHQAVLSL